MIKKLFLLVTIVLLNNFNVSSQVLEADSLVLVELYNLNPSSNINWDLNQNVSTWEGIALNDNRVSSINCYQKNISKIPNSINTLIELTALNFNYNNISNIPRGLDNLIHLKNLLFFGNNITNIPDEIGNINTLNILSLGDNSIYHIPENLENLTLLTRAFFNLNFIGYSGLEQIKFSALENYSPQKDNINTDTTILLYSFPYIITTPDSATNNQYQWYNENGVISGETNRSINISQEGTYHCIITNINFPDLAQVQTGEFTLINAADFLNDSTAVANIYTMNSNNTLGWDLTMPIATWQGVTHSGNPQDRIKALNINQKNITILPSNINELDALDSLFLINNHFIFEELEKITQTYPNEFLYNPQKNVGQSKIITYTGNPITLTLPTEINSTNNTYQWFKDGVQITDNANTNTYTTSELGTFHCEIKNNLFLDLTLISEPQYILDPNIFTKDSSAVADIYNKNITNTLNWNLNEPITTWEGVLFANGRVNSLKINNTSLDTIPRSIADLNLLDTLWVDSNSISFEMLENITASPSNFIYNPQSNIGYETSIEISNGETVELIIPSSFDPNTNNNNFQWYFDNNNSPIENANGRSITVNKPGYYFCLINNNQFPDLTIATENYIVYNKQLLEADSTILVQIFNDNTNNTLNWNLNNSITTWEGVNINNYRVTSLILNNKKIDSLTSSIDELNMLDSLIINNNQLTEIPEELGSVVNLKVLEVNNNKITQIPNNLTQLSNLNKIDLSYNLIETLPNQSGIWNNANSIYLNNNKLTFDNIKLINSTINEYIYSPQDSMSDNRYLSISRSVEIFIDTLIDKNIKSNIQWYHNNTLLKDENNKSIYTDIIGDYTYKYTNVEYDELTLTSKKIELTQSNNIDEIDSLAVLDFKILNPNSTIKWSTENNINTWEGVTIFENRVTDLNLFDKNVSIIPTSIKNISNLNSLNLNNNIIENIPTEIENLTRLNSLLLLNNKINFLPDGIGNLPLKVLSLEGNNINIIPATFSNLTSLTRTFIANNKIGYSGVEKILYSSIETINPQNNLNRDTTILLNNFPYTLTAPDSATNNKYQWHNENGAISNETNRSITITQDGIYHCIITNPDFPDLAQVQTGTYTLANGSDFWADSTALLSLKASNPNLAVNWSTTEMVEKWDSVSHSGFAGDPVSAVRLENMGLVDIPANFMDDGALLHLDTFNIANNELTFYDLYNAQQVINQTNELVKYHPQAVVGQETSIGYTNNAIRLHLDISLQDIRNTYQWYKDDVVIVNATDSFYVTSDIGNYQCIVTNTDFSALTLASAMTFIYDQNAFDQDSIIVRSIAEQNSNNTLNWDLSTPIDTWEGVTLRGGRVQNLQLNNKTLTTLPDNIGNLSALDILRIGNNQLTTLPLSIGHFNHLKTLDIHQNNISTIEDTLFANVHLEVLEIQNNTITNLSERIGDLQQLSTLKLAHNNLPALPQKINALQQLSTLTVNDNFLSFEDIELLPSVSSLPTYAPQGIIGNVQNVHTPSFISISIESNIDSLVTDNQYQWQYEGNQIPGATERSYTATNQYGEFVCIINNPRFTALTLTVASIFVVPSETDQADSLVLVNIKEQNEEHTLNWPSNEPVGLWEGVVVNGMSTKVVELDIWNKNIDLLPTSFTNLDELKSVNISANNLFELPDDIENITSNLVYFNASQNHLSFAELDKVRLKIDTAQVNFVYTNQKMIGEEDLTVTLENGYNYLAVPPEDTTNNDRYTWYYLGNPITGELSDSLKVKNTGEYNYSITNSSYKNVILTSFPITVDGVTGIDDHPIYRNLSLYPNPTNGIITVQSKGNLRIIAISIFDVMGKEFLLKVKSKEMYQWEIDMEKMPTGMYFIGVKTNEGNVTMKVYRK